jgi:hypothetical protein
MFVFNAIDVLLFESAQQRFRFDETEGPQVVQLAAWSYAASVVGRFGPSVAEVQTVAQPLANAGTSPPPDEPPAGPASKGRR